jgi:hypothetical protein
MRRESLLIVLTTVLVSLASVTGSWGEETAARNPFQPTLENQPYSWIQIRMANREHPLEVYKRICLEEVLPQFVAEMKRQDPTIDEKKYLEEIKGTIVRVNQPENKLDIYMKRGMLDFFIKPVAEMAVRAFASFDQPEILERIVRLEKEKERMTAELENLREQAEAADQDLAAWGEAAYLKSRLDSCTTQLMEAELQRAELRARLDLLARRAEQVKDAVSPEQIAVLEKIAQDLSMQLDEASMAGHRNELEKLKAIVEEKEEAYVRVKQLHERGLVSEKEFERGETDLRLAANDLRQAEIELSGLSSRLSGVQKQLAEAKDKLANTGGLGLATVIAERILTCEIEIASAETRVQRLEEEVLEARKRMDIRRNLVAHVGQIESRTLELRAQWKSLCEEINKADRGLNEVLHMKKMPKDYYSEGNTLVLMPEEVGYYEVFGEVKRPGDFEIQRETTVAEAIEAAGGFSENADVANVVIIRRSLPEGAPVPVGSFHKYVVDCGAILKGESPDDFIIKPYDVVFVSRKASAE